MKSILYLLLEICCTLGAAEPIWVIDFESPEVQKAVKACRFAKVSKDFEGTNVLTLCIPKEKANTHGTVGVLLPLNLKKLGFPDAPLLPKWMWKCKRSQARVSLIMA